MSVFVTVGTTRFDALVRAASSPVALSLLAELGHTDLRIQYGSGEYVPFDAGAGGSAAARVPPPLRCEAFDFKPGLAEEMAGAALVISHAGSGSIMEALALRKPLLVVVNDQLMDNHQAEVAEALAAQGHLYYCSPGTLVETLRGADFSKLRPLPPVKGEKFIGLMDETLGFDRAA